MQNNFTETTDNFDSFYRAQITPILAPFWGQVEKDKKKRNQIWKYLSIFLFVLPTLLTVFIPLLMHNPHFDWQDIGLGISVGILLLILLSLIFIILPYGNEELILSLKNKVFNAILTLFKDFKLSKSYPKLIYMNEINSFGLCNKAVDQYISCVISGYYKNIEVLIEETTLKHELQNVDIIDFEGFIIKTKLNKDFGKIISLIYNGISQNIESFKLKRIKSEDVELDSMFDIYSSDNQTEFQQLFGADCMEKFKNIMNFFIPSVAYIDFAIKNDLFYIFVKSDNKLFETNKIISNISNEGNYRKIYNRLVYIFELLEYFEFILKKQENINSEEMQNEYETMNDTKRLFKTIYMRNKRASKIRNTEPARLLKTLFLCIIFFTICFQIGIDGVVKFVGIIARIIDYFLDSLIQSFSNFL